MSRHTDGFPPPTGHITSGVSKDGVSSHYSEVNPYGKELAIFRSEEFSKMEAPCIEDFLVGTSAVDGERRYIRKAFIESVCAHKKGSIVRTFSGDFHVITENPRSFEHRVASRYSDWVETGEELLKTKVRELTQTLDAAVERINFLEKAVKEADDDRKRQRT